MWKILRYFTVTACIIYLGICAYLYIMQRSLLYRTDATIYAAPDKKELPHIQVVDVQTRDGITLRSWYQPPTSQKQTILYLHGNASGLPTLQKFYRQITEAGYGLLALSYRGYTGNEGTPTEQGLYTDAHAGMEFLQNKGISSNQIIIMGRSLGSGVAVEIAGYYALYGVVLLSPYTTMTEVAKGEYPYIPVELLLKDTFESIHKAGRISAPTLVFHGMKDILIPYEQGQRLFEALETKKQLFLYEEADHYTIPFDHVIKMVNLFHHMKKN